MATQITCKMPYRGILGRVTGAKRELFRPSKAPAREEAALTVEHAVELHLGVVLSGH